MKQSNQTDGLIARLKELGCETDRETVQGFLSERGVGSGDVDDNLLFEMVDVLAKQPSAIAKSEQGPISTKPRKGQGRGKITRSGNQILDAQIEQARSVVSGISGVAAEVWAAVPAAIDAEIDIQLEGQAPRIQQATDQRIADQQAAISKVIFDSRSRANEFLSRYGGVA